jgi:hypothetical protein
MLTTNIFADNGHRDGDRRPEPRPSEHRRGEHGRGRGGEQDGDVFASLMISNTILDFLNFSTVTDNNNYKIGLVRLENESNEFFQSNEMGLYLTSAVARIKEVNADMSDEEAVEAILDFVVSVK